MTALRFTTNHAPRIAFDDRGSGRPVILGHSFLCDRSMWAPQVPELASRYRVLNADLRGHGESNPVERPATLDDLVGDALAVLDEAGVDRAAWIGLSVGGMVALRAALAHPARVAALALVDTDAGPENAWRRFKYSALGYIARPVGLPRMVGQINPLMFGKTTRRSNPALVAHWSERFANLDLESILNVQQAIIHRPDIRNRLPGITVPSLVLVGDEDVALPPARSRQIASGLPGARYREITGAGHLTAVEQPDAVTGALLAFLDAVYA